MLLRSALAAGLFLCPSVLAANVLVVDDDPGPGVDFTDLAPALAAAGPGDILLVREGSYAGFSISAKPAAVLAEDGATVQIQGDVLVSGIPQGSAFVLRGFEFPNAGSRVVASQSSGSIRLEDLDLTATFALPGGDLLASRIELEQCAHARLSNVRLGFDGGNPATEPSIGPSPLEAPPAALSIRSSDVHLHECDVFGTPGRDAFDDPLTLLGTFATSGGDAVEVDGTGLLRLVGSRVLGGAGGDGWQSASVGCIAPEDGGAGVRFLTGLTHTFSNIDTELAGGGAGATVDQGLGFTCPATAQAGPAVAQEPGTTVGGFEQQIPLPQLAVEAWLQEDEAVTLSFLREAGDEAVVALSLVDGSVITPFTSVYVGLEVGPPQVLIPLGVANVLGAASLTVPAPGDVLPAGTGLTLYTQALAVDLAGQLWIGQFATSALLDAAF